MTRSLSLPFLRVYDAQLMSGHVFSTEEQKANWSKKLLFLHCTMDPLLYTALFCSWNISFYVTLRQCPFCFVGFFLLLLKSCLHWLPCSKREKDALILKDMGHTRKLDVWMKRIFLKEEAIQSFLKVVKILCFLHGHFCKKRDKAETELPSLD